MRIHPLLPRILWCLRSYFVLPPSMCTLFKVLMNSHGTNRMNEGVIVHIKRCEGLDGQFGNHVTKLVILGHDEASLFIIECVVDEKNLPTPIAPVGEVHGFHSIALLFPNIIPIYSVWLDIDTSTIIPPAMQASRLWWQYFPHHHVQCSHGIGVIPELDIFPTTLLYLVMVSVTEIYSKPDRGHQVDGNHIIFVPILWFVHIWVQYIQA